MKTILELANTINAHLAKGGLVMDAYRGEGQVPVTEACLDSWNGCQDSVLLLRCPDKATGFGSSILYDFKLEVHGHEVHYFIGTVYWGKVVFLIPASVDLIAARADAARAAAAYVDAAANAYANAMPHFDAPTTAL